LQEVAEATSPTDPFIYAIASRDLNPIHRNYYLAEIADLPNGAEIKRLFGSAINRKTRIGTIFLPRQARDKLGKYFG
jgi:hypothetical protein